MREEYAQPRNNLYSECEEKKMYSLVSPHLAAVTQQNNSRRLFKACLEPDSHLQSDNILTKCARLHAKNILIIQLTSKCFTAVKTPLSVLSVLK